MIIDHKNSCSGFCYLFTILLMPYTNYPFLRCFKPLYQSETWCTNFRLKMILTGLMRDYVTFSKFTTKPRLREIFSNFRCLRVVFTWVFFSSLLLWELVHDKIYILHYQNKICGVFCWSDVITHNDYLLVIDISFSYKGWALGIVLRKANGSFFGNGLYQSDI